MQNEEKLLARVDGLAAFDLDSTLRNPTKDIYGSAIKGTLKRSRGLLAALFAYGRRQVGLDSRDEFAAKAPGLYQRLLLENGVDRMEAFYQKAAKNRERIHAGSVELVRELIKRNIGIALITGSDEDFVRIFLKENGIDPDIKVEILASRYEKTADGSSYTGNILESHVGSVGKKRVVDELMQEYPGMPIVMSGGDDEADKPATDRVISSGLRIVVGKDSDFRRQLTSDGYVLCESLEEYFVAPEGNRVLVVSKHAGKGKLTLIDVHAHLDELLPKADRVLKRG